MADDVKEHRLEAYATLTLRTVERSQVMPNGRAPKFPIGGPKWPESLAQGPEEAPSPQESFRISESVSVSLAPSGLNVYLANPG
jgi:hypothetical protein